MKDQANRQETNKMILKEDKSNKAKQKTKLT